MTDEETPKLVVSSNDRIMSKVLAEETITTAERWELSEPIPGADIVNTWQIYPKVWLALAKTDDGHYNLYRSFNLQTYEKVHEHDTRIYDVFYIDDGHVLFCAEDGWWGTVDTATTWVELDVTAIIARGAAIINLREGAWAIVAYAPDRKIYYVEYPVAAEDDFEEVYDTTEIWQNKWYPAIAGSSMGCILAGAGSKLIRSLLAGAEGSWQEVLELKGPIKSIVVSNQSTVPVFLITVERTDEQGENYDSLYSTTDLGDSVKLEANRIESIAAVQSVTPTGTNEIQTMFAVLGQKSTEQATTYRIIEG